jgi:hypothetical protein
MPGRTRRVSTESEVVPRPMPNGRRPCGRLRPPSGSCRDSSSSAFGALPAGYSAWMSMPACCFSRSMREHGPLIWLPAVAGTASHLPPGTAEILDRAVDRAVLLDQVLHDVVDRLEQLRVLGRQPGRDSARMSWPDFAWASAAIGEQVLVALRGDVVDLDLDLLLGRPLLDQVGRGLVGVRNPVVPEADRQACRRRAMCGHRERRSRPWKPAPRDA